MKAFPFLLASLLFAVGASTATAQTTHNVDLVGISFTPAHITIAEGDTVVWHWVSGLHNVESNDGFFSSGVPVTGPNTFSVTFDAAFLAASPANGNVYGYHCEVHEAFGMVGSVTVDTANPVLTISNFLAGQTTSFTVTNATPGAPVGFAYSLTGAGPTTLPAGPCGPVTASLSAPITILPQVNADGTGTAVLPAAIPAGSAGVTVWVQALDLGSCSLSNGAMMIIG
jgi:plastocyanin